MKPSMQIGCLFVLYLHMSVPVCCAVTVSNIMITPDEPIIGESATLTCHAMGYDQFAWQRSINGTVVDVAAGERIVFGPISQVFDSVYQQTVTINRLQESDEGKYLCIVIKRSNGNLVNGEGYLYVNYLNEFPVCFPNGPAVVAVGDTLSCKTVIDKRIPVVRLSGVPGKVREDWIWNNDTESVMELRKYVTVEDEDLIFVCYSVSIDTPKAHSCIIGPLTFVPLTFPTCPPSPCQSSSLVIAGFTLSVLVILACILINLLCFRYDPRSWHQLLGFCGRHRQRDRPQSGSGSAWRQGRSTYVTSIGGSTNAVPITLQDQPHDQHHYEEPNRM